jgi:predicted acyl esterase
VTITIRKGNVGFNDPVAESAFPKRAESAWPLPHTQYTKYFLTPDKELVTTAHKETKESKLTYNALGSIGNFQGLRFQTRAFEREIEITGHVSAHLNVSITPDSNDEAELDKDIDLFLTLRHIDPSGKEVLYTGTAGDGVPLTKGWLRCSMRRVHEEHPR